MQPDKLQSQFRPFPLKQPTSQVDQSRDTQTIHPVTHNRRWFPIASPTV